MENNNQRGSDYRCPVKTEHLMHVRTTEGKKDAVSGNVDEFAEKFTAALTSGRIQREE